MEDKKPVTTVKDPGYVCDRCPSIDSTKFREMFPLDFSTNESAFLSYGRIQAAAANGYGD